jgi:hypothetical protein
MSLKLDSHVHRFDEDLDDVADRLNHLDAAVQARGLERQRLSLSATDAAPANSLWARSTPITLAARLSRAPSMAANGVAGVS